MKPPTHDDIAVRAYKIWEARGQPTSDEISVECWQAAEREFSESADPTDQKSAPAVEVTNLDRALPAEERRRSRDARQTETPKAKLRDEPKRFVVVLNRAQLRIYEDERTPEGVGGPLHLAEAFELPAGKEHYTDRDTDQAGRFPGSKGTRGNKGSGVAGGSIDERLPMQEEHQRRIASELSARVDAFLLGHPQARWNFAAGPGLHHAVLEALTPSVRQRLGQAIHKDVVKQPLPELRSHFEEEHAVRS